MSRWKFLIRFLCKLILIAAGIWFIVTYVMVPYRVSGMDMAPALQDGDLGLFYAFGSCYADDVVLYQSYDGLCVGRVMAKGGQTVDFSEGSGILVDGYGIDAEPYRSMDGGLLQEYPLTVPEGSFFLCNVYADSRKDSRAYGVISEKDVKGKLLFLLRRRDF